MADDKLRILIVEDSQVTARMLRGMLETQPDFTVVGTAETGQEAVRRTTELHPDVILMDIHLPDVDGIQTTWLIASKNPDSSIIIVTSEAVNLAVVLRAATEKSVALVDFDLRFGDANILLDLPGERSIIDIIPHIDEL